jgi:hypothetical protein
MGRRKGKQFERISVGNGFECLSGGLDDGDLMRWDSYNSRRFVNFDVHGLGNDLTRQFLYVRNSIGFRFEETFECFVGNWMTAIRCDWILNWDWFIRV